MENAWREAGRQLNVRVVAPYLARSADTPARFIAFLPDFGGQHGMVIDRFGPPDDTKDAFARDTQLYVSRLADSYATFDRKLFIETLNDWGWFAQDRAAPHWYTGRPWS